MINTTKFIPVDFDPFAEGNEIEKITLTNDSQREIWLSCIIGGEDANLAYNESVSLDFEGKLNLNAFKKAMSNLVLRHEALRSTVSPNGETLIIYKDYPIALDLEDLSTLDQSLQKESLNLCIKKAIASPLDLSAGPLFKVFLHKLSENRFYFTLIKHHVIGDGWSTGIMLEDLSKMYNSYIEDQDIALGRPSQISDYAIAQDRFKLSNTYKDTEAYWLNIYKDNVPQVDLPTDRPRQSPRSYHGNRVDYPLSNTLVSQLKAVGAKSGSSLVTTLLSAFELFLYETTKQKDIVVGLPASGQAASGMYDVVGHCVNLLPLRTSINTNQSFTSYLKKRKGEVLDAYEHQRMTFGELIKKLYIPRDSSRITLVPVIFNIDMGMDQAVTFNGLKHRLVSNPRDYENFEIYLNATGSKEGIVLEWSYNTALFDQNTIESYHKNYTALLERIVANPDFILTELRGKGEGNNLKLPERKIINEVNESLTELIYRSAKKHTEKTALTFDNVSLSYKELNERSNKLANFLLSKQVKANDRIAISTDRSIEMIITVLAILKTGSAYVPIDNSYPTERINFVLENSSAKYLLVPKAHADRYAEIKDKVIFIEDALEKAKGLQAENLDVVTEKHSLVYILHTSGSTGIPKGVCMGQNALVNLLLWQEQQSMATVGTNTLQFSPLSFDVSFQEIFATLTTGGTLVLISEETRLDPYLLLDVITGKQVNRIFLPFVALQSITEAAVSGHIYPACLKEVMTAGEQLKITAQIVKFFSNIPDSVLYNQYGPTEAHVVTELKLTGDPAKWPNLPSIGKEISNTQMFIVDEKLAEIQPGDVGELCISGLCLAEGYLGLPEMTAEKFTKLPDSEIRIYRTGDLAKFLPDGNIEFLGRRDSQVKIRGFRIELGEIETHLNNQTGVKQAVVSTQEDENGNKKLIAYITSDTPELTKKESVSWHDRWDAIYDLGVHSEHQQDGANQNLDKLILKQISNSDRYDDQADEWIIESANRIKAIGAKRIVEIGCGGGQFITEISPFVDQYLATDYSEVAVAYINDKIKADPEKWKNVSAVVSEANDFSGLSDISPDLILINSVIQYFPNTKYLFDVIEQAANIIPKGCIFIGDVQGLTTLKMHHAAEQLLHSPDSMSIADFEESVNRRVNIEDELMVDPEFFYFIKQKLPTITHVDVQLRKGQFINETTKYHYDVWLYVNAEINVSEPDQTLDWGDLRSADLLKKTLSKTPLKTIVVSNIPNQRTWKDYQLIRLLNQITETESVGALKHALDKEDDDTFDPEVFWKLGDELGFKAYVRWSNDGSNGTFEAVFIPANKFVSGCIKPSEIQSSNSKLKDFEEPVHILIHVGNNEPAISWKKNLTALLPEYMIPGEFVILNKLPLTASGKIDRKALPVLSKFAGVASSQSITSPRTANERLVADIWSDLLNIKNISIDSDFFELGGHSLIAVKAMVAIEKETGKRLPLATLFENSTIERLAKMISADEDEIKWDSLVPIKKTGSKTPIYMIHGGGLNVLVFNPLGRYMDKEQPVYGMQALGLNGKTELLYSMEDLADKYNAEILNNDPIGPYALAGYSFGGLLAYEMAKRLIAMGKEVTMLGILDTFAGGKDKHTGIAEKIFKKILRQFKKVIFFGGLLIKNPSETINYQTLVIKRKIKALSGNKVTTYDQVFHYDDEILRSYDVAWQTYMMQPLDIHVDVFRTKKRIYFLDDMEYLGWREYAKKGVTVHEVPGDHKTFLFPPYDKEFAEILQQVLDSRS